MDYVKERRGQDISDVIGSLSPPTYKVQNNCRRLFAAHLQPVSVPVEIKEDRNSLRQLIG